MAAKEHCAELFLFGQRIKELRNKKDLSQRQLGQITSINKRTIQRIENGEHPVGLNLIFALAKALEISPGKLFKEIEVAD